LACFGVVSRLTLPLLTAKQRQSCMPSSDSFHADKWFAGSATSTVLWRYSFILRTLFGGAVE
jgi:hypothetical protein